MEKIKPLLCKHYNEGKGQQKKMEGMEHIPPYFESVYWRNGKRYGNKKEKLAIVKLFLVLCRMEAKLMRKSFK